MKQERYDWKLDGRGVGVCYAGRSAEARQPGPGCMTTSQPIYRQGGRKSASLVQLSPDALTSQIGCQLLPLQPTFWDSDSFNLKCHGRQLASSRYNLGGGSVWDVVVQPSPGAIHSQRARSLAVCVLISANRYPRGEGGGGAWLHEDRGGPNHDILP